MSRTHMFGNKHRTIIVNMKRAPTDLYRSHVVSGKCVGGPGTMAIRHTQPGESLVPRRKKARRTKWDWPKVRDMYVEGVQTDPDDILALHWPTIAEVAKAFGIPEHTVSIKCSQQRWVEQKNTFIQTITIKRRRKRTGELAKVASQFDNNVLNIGQIGMAIVANRLGRIARVTQEREQYQRQIQQAMERGELVDLDNPMLNSNVVDVDSKEMLDLAMAAQKFDDIARRVLGPIDPDDADIADIANEEQISIRDRMQDPDADRLAIAVETLQNIGFDTIAEVMGGSAGESMLELESGRHGEEDAHDADRDDSVGDGSRQRSRFSIGADDVAPIEEVPSQTTGSQRNQGPVKLTEFQKQVLEANKTPVPSS